MTEISLPHAPAYLDTNKRLETATQASVDKATENSFKKKLEAESAKRNASINNKQQLKSIDRKFKEEAKLNPIGDKLKNNRNISVKNFPSSPDGTDLALKEVAQKAEQQFYGIMWNMAFKTGSDNLVGGLGEELFRDELVNEMVKGTYSKASDSSSLGEVAEMLYKELKAKQGRQKYDGAGGDIKVGSK